MKRKLLYSILSVFAFMGTNGQTISIVGTGVNGWPPDNDPEITLSTTDNINFTIQDLEMNTGEIKFRLNMDWGTAWGNSSSPDWPSGIASTSGDNISTVAGTYDVFFNIETGEYSFIGSSAFPSIGIWGPAVDPVNGFDGADVDMTTLDGEEYIFSGFDFASGPARFRQDNNSAMTWANSGFPSGIALPDGEDIPVEAGNYTVYFNLITGEYTFGFPSVGVIGSAIGSWDVDVDMTTTDGIVYTLTAQSFIDASPELTEIKFRQDDTWLVNWGTGGINPNLLIPGGMNIAVSPGVFDIMFNRQTLEFSITPSLAVNDQVENQFRTFPNPMKSDLQIASENVQIHAVDIYNFEGRLILSANPMATEIKIDISNLASGSYFAKISSADSVQTVKLIKL